MSDFQGEPCSWTSESILCSDAEDEASEMDNDYFFLVTPSEEMGRSLREGRRPSLLRVPAKSAEDAFTTIVESDLPVTIERGLPRPRSVTMFDEDFDEYIPPAPPLHLASPVCVATNRLDPFVTPKEGPQPQTETRSLPDQLDDDDTPLQGLDLDELEMYLDEDEEGSLNESRGSNKFFFFPDGEEKTEERVKKERKLADFFKSLVSCLSPKSCTKIQHPLKIQHSLTVGKAGRRCSPTHRVNVGTKEVSRDETASAHATASLVAIKYRPSNQVICHDYLPAYSDAGLNPNNLPRSILVPILR